MLLLLINLGCCTELRVSCDVHLSQLRLELAHVHVLHVDNRVCLRKLGVRFHVQFRERLLEPVDMHVLFVHHCVRFLAQHAAVAYYWALVVLFMASPSLGYLFSVLLEGHAVDTYQEFIESNEVGSNRPRPNLSPGAAREGNPARIRRLTNA